MSQRVFRARSAEHGKVKVLAGWDRPLGYSFLTLLNDREEAVFSNLDTTGNPDIPVPQVKRVLERFGLPIPRGFLEALERDRQRQMGNLAAVYMPYEGDGAVQVEVWHTNEAEFIESHRTFDFDFVKLETLEETHHIVDVFFETSDATPLERAERAFKRYNLDEELLRRLQVRSLSSGDCVRIQTPSESVTLMVSLINWTRVE
jgi:hypothetical protein